MNLSVKQLAGISAPDR